MRNLTALVALGLLTAAAHGNSTLDVSADFSVGISFQGDINAANNNPGIASQPTLKAAVSAGDDLLVGMRVLIGTFTQSDANLIANGTDVGYLISNFKMYGVAQIGDNVSSTSTGNGIFSSSLSANADTLGIANQQIYFFVLGSTNNTSLATSISTAFQVGVFYYDKSLSSDWQFKAENAFPPTGSIELSDLTVGSAGTTLATGAHVVLGSFGPDTPNNLAGPGKNFTLMAVPEPGSAALALGGGIAVLLRRRRR